MYMSNMNMSNRPNKKDRLQRETALIQTLRRIRRGAADALRDPRKFLTLALLLPLVLMLWTCRHQVLGYAPGSILTPLYNLAALFMTGTLLLGLPVVLFWLWGGPLRAVPISNNLYRAGFTNSAWEAPTLLNIATDAGNPRVRIYEFYSCGIPLTDWQERCGDLQAAINVTVADIRQGRDNQHILVAAVPGSCRLPGMLPWSPAYASQEEGVVAVGESLLGRVFLDLNVLPHFLIGGSTGSGKTNLLQLILMQLLRQGSMVFIVDFKGAVDYLNRAWCQDSRLVFTPEELTAVLEQFIVELEARKTAFREAGTGNILEYRRKTGQDLSRCVLAVDEFAEVLDKTGASKEQKEQIAKIEAMLATLARQGRAFGMNLFLCTQRPDAGILAGQIKNNLLGRLCGNTPDPELRRMILGDTPAADAVPPDAKGRFITQDGTPFQAYYFDTTLSVHTKEGGAG